MIEHYEFGRMRVNGKNYSQDLIIFPEKVKDNWWRVEGHRLKIEDLKEVLEAKPKFLVVGCGASSCLKVSEEIKKFLKEKGIELIHENTQKAVQIFNDLSPKERVIGAFHLTC